MRMVRLLASLLVGALVVAACGDGDDQAVTTTTTTASPAPSADCSAAALDEAPPVSLELTAPVAQTADAVRTAALACDLDALAALALDGTFTASFGGGLETEEALAQFWRDAEERGEPVTAWLVQLLSLPFVPRADTEPPLEVAPRAHVITAGEDGDGEDVRTELVDVFGAATVDGWFVDGEYLGPRIGFEEDGGWAFYILGGD